MTRAHGTTLAEKVADTLRRQIAAGRLSPGERLPGERQLADRMGVSRVSVRAALQALKAQGYLRSVQGGGTTVVSAAETMDPALSQMVRLSLANLQDLAEIRAALETWGVRRAAKLATPELLDELEDLINRMERDAARGRMRTEDDIRFHYAIAQATSSTVYLHLLETIRDILHRMVSTDRAMLFAPADDQEIVAHHRAIFEAIRDGDADAAAVGMERHLDWIVAHYRSLRRAGRR